MNVLVINAGSSSLKYQLMDPETGDGNGSWYPIQRVFNFGVNIVF